jgi:hypothetical protein
MNNFEYEIRRFYLLSGRTVDSRNEEAIELMAQEVIKAGIDLDTLKKGCMQLIKDNVKLFGLGDILNMCGQYKPVKKIVYPPEQFDEDGDPEYLCDVCSDRGEVRATLVHLGRGNNIQLDEQTVACSCRVGKQVAELYRYYQWDGVSETIEANDGGIFVLGFRIGDYNATPFTNHIAIVESVKTRLKREFEERKARKKATVSKMETTTPDLLDDEKLPF